MEFKKKKRRDKPDRFPRLHTSVQGQYIQSDTLEYQTTQGTRQFSINFMVNYNISKNKALNIKTALSRITTVIISITIFLIFFEGLLQISGLVYVKPRCKVKTAGVLKNNSTSFNPVC